MRSQKAARARADSSSKLAFVLDRRSPGPKASALKPDVARRDHCGRRIGLQPEESMNFPASF